MMGKRKTVRQYRSRLGRIIIQVDERTSYTLEPGVWTTLPEEAARILENTQALQGDYEVREVPEEE